MPRTRQVKKNSLHNESLPAHHESKRKALEIYEECYKQKRRELLESKQMAIVNYSLFAKQKKLEIPVSLGNKKISELRQSFNWNTMSSVRHGTFLNSVVLNNNSTKKKTSDDGYLTSDSATETAGVRRTSRSRSKIRDADEPVRRSSRARSLSKNPSACSTVTKPARRSRSMCKTSKQNRFKTPLNNKKLDNFGMVTPKMKPNTPSIVLRRPCQGEVAISLRGSPLMTTAMVIETTANVNIPLADGRMMNIQPRRGLRASEIPDLDPEIQKQLRTLRDNLDKVCQLSCKK